MRTRAAARRPSSHGQVPKSGRAGRGGDSPRDERRGTATAVADETAKFEYLGGADAMVEPDRDIFEHIGSMMPGDSETGVVEVRNSSNVPVRLWFWAEEDIRGTEAAESMLSAMTIEIVDMDTERAIYTGLLHPDGYNDPIDLGLYAPGAGARLAYEVTLPAELTNEYMEQAAGITWTFAAEDEPETSGKTPLSDTKGAGGHYAKTGVETGGALGLGALFVAVGAGGIAIARKMGTASR